MSQKDYKTFEKFELPVSRGKRNSCEVCAKEFKLFVREHQCKRCGRSVCEECGAYKALIYSANFQRKPHRLCKLCNPESEFIKNYVQHYKLAFGESSEISEKWMKRIRSESEGQRSPTRIETRREVVFSEEMFNELWNSYNYSLREFVGCITFQRKQNEIHKLLYGALQDLGSRVEVRLQTTTYLLVFLLCFCSVEEATKIAHELLILAKSDPPLRDNITSCLKQLGCEEGDRRKLDEYVDYRYRRFCGLFGMNCITFEGSLFLMDQVVSKRSCAELDRYFAALVHEQREEIIRNTRSKYEMDLHIIRSLNAKIMEKVYVSLCKLELRRRPSNLSADVSPLTKKSVIMTASVSMSPPVRSIEEERTAGEPVDIRRTVSTVEDSEALRTRVVELESVIAGMKKTQPTQERDFRKKVSSFEDDSRVSELLARNQELERLLAARSETSARIGSNEASMPGEQEELIADLQQRLKKHSIESSRLQLQLQGKLSILQKQVQIAQREKEALGEQLESSKDELRKGAKQVKSLESTIEIMRMKMENMELETKGPAGPSLMGLQELEELRKENSLLTNSLKEKNQKIGDLLKQIKLLNFELQQKEAIAQMPDSTAEKPPQYREAKTPSKEREPSGPGAAAGRTEQLQKENRQLRSSNERLMRKMQELSQTLMAEQEQLIVSSRKSFSESQQTSAAEPAPDKNREGCKPY